MIDALDHASLKARQRAEREGHSDGLALRVHRALSWLDRAEQCEDLDGRFIFLWISFNAAYAQDLSGLEMSPEQQKLNQFLQKIVDLDRDRRLYQLVWGEFSGSIRVLLQNPFIFKPFWDFQNGQLSDAEWRADFARANHAAGVALGHQDCANVLGVVLARMYMLRNQLVHGGATWNSRVNRDQLSDCTRFLGKLVPQIITVMMDHPETLWGSPVFPVVEV